MVGGCVKQGVVEEEGVVVVDHAILLTGEKYVRLCILNVAADREMKLII